MRILMFRKTRLLALLAGAAMMVPAAVQADTKGPVEGKPALNLGDYDLAKLGYVVEEYFISGTANSYKAAGPLTIDGKWTATPDAKAPFVTRIVVVRPKTAAKFNGTVVVEWLNVSGGADAGPDWQMAHRELLRGGYAWVGVSAQKVGVEGGNSLSLGGKPLKVRDPARYGSLSHPGDAFSYDIFTAAARAVRGLNGRKVLGPLKARHVLGDGESQSSIYLATYVNAIDPLAKQFDGFLIHSRGSGVAPIGGAIFGVAPPADFPKAVQIRDDARVPVLTVETETDVTQYFHARQPDSTHIRTWEIPGTSHADIYMIRTANIDSGLEGVDALAAAYAPDANVLGTTLAKPMNAAPQHHYVMNAAVAALNAWVKDGKAPPHGMPITLKPGMEKMPFADFARDAQGNALGGVRTPWMDVPVVTYSGLGNSGSRVAMLAGSTVPFSADQLATLYPGGKAEYLLKFRVALKSAIAAGFILPADEQEILALAATSWPVK